MVLLSFDQMLLSGIYKARPRHCVVSAGGRDGRAPSQTHGGGACRTARAWKFETMTGRPSFAEPRARSASSASQVLTWFGTERNEACVSCPGCRIAKRPGYLLKRVRPAGKPTECAANRSFSVSISRWHGLGEQSRDRRDGLGWRPQEVNGALTRVFPLASVVNAATAADARRKLRSSDSMSVSCLCPLL